MHLNPNPEWFREVFFDLGVYEGMNPKSENVAPHNPPPRESLGICRLPRTLEWLPAPFRGRGR